MIDQSSLQKINTFK